MTDVHSTLVRSKNMKAIRAKNTGPEMLVRKSLHACGFRYRLHVRELPGKPDIVLPKYRTVIFVHGCFWHQHQGCKYAVMPKSNHEFWQRKLDANTLRDALNIMKLEQMGWRCLVVWECETKRQDFVSNICELMQIS